MKIALQAFLIALSLTGDVRASGAVSVEITTTDAQSSYMLYKGGHPAAVETKTPDEIETWLRSSIKYIGDRKSVVIYADDRTSFRVVSDMLRRFKAAGVKHAIVFTGRDAGGPSVSISLDKFLWHTSDTSPPPQ